MLADQVHYVQLFHVSADVALLYEHANCSNLYLFAASIIGQNFRKAKYHVRFRVI